MRPTEPHLSEAGNATLFQNTARDRSGIRSRITGTLRPRRCACTWNSPPGVPFEDAESVRGPDEVAIRK